MHSASSSTGANSPVFSNSTSQEVPSSPKPGPSRQTHIHFPSEPASASSRSPGSPSISGAGLRSLESSTKNEQVHATPGSSLDVDFFERRRVRSALASESLRPPIGAYVRTQYLSDTVRSRSSGKRTVSQSLFDSDRSNKRGTSSIGSSPLSGGVLLPSEGDNEAQDDDPNILADLHKALRYKPHVEQHLKEAKSVSQFPSHTFASTSSPSNASPTLHKGNGYMPYSEPDTPPKAEFIDFSPSTGRSSLYPIPKSSDDGATLDWSGSVGKDEKHERKWTMSLTRKTSKDKDLPFSRKALVEKQDTQYSEKLARIRAKTNEHTIRKAEITRDQLQRRYAASDASYMSSGSHLNLADVARWYDKQETTVKARFAESDSMPWLRHLHFKRGLRQHEHRKPSPWNLSAMIVDHYVRAHSDTELFLSPTSGGDDASDVGSSVSAAKQRQVSKPVSFGSLHAPLAPDPSNMVSMVQAQRDSLGAESRKSVDSQLKRWRQSVRVDMDVSSESSVDRERTQSSERRNVDIVHGPPANTRSALQSLGVSKLLQSTPAQSDDGQSSAADSMADRYNQDQEAGGKVKKKSRNERRRGRFPLSLDMKSGHHWQGETKSTPPLLSLADLRTDASQPAKSQSLPIGKERSAIGSVDTFEDEVPSNNHLGSPIVLTPARKNDERRSQRLSLPPSFQAPRVRRHRADTRTEAQRHALQVEYNRKQELLDALLARNQRMRNLLQIAARSIIEYNETQSAMSEKLGLEYSQLPPEVLEALKHDPSVSTGHLRYLKGWRAVEDIHHRRERQREILGTFVASLPEAVTFPSMPKGGIYSGTIADLADLVEQLHKQRNAMLPRVHETQELLSKVKQMRDELKPVFDETSKHTSANYPELVRLETLLDEIVNETNPLWRIAETSLSFVLTSAAPIMKTFGRPVWDELHDFLVIPLYRNGFSGEDHWYPVTFPRRSFVHWLRLLFFGSCIPLILFHGSRAFVALLTHGYIIRIPSFIPTFVVYIIFSGLMCAFAFTLLGFLVAVLCEVFIFLWWTLWLLHIVQ